MKRYALGLIALFVCLGLFTPAIEARERVFGWCEQGGQTVNTAGLASTSTVQASFPLCTVTIYDAGTLDIATIFADDAGTPKANPFTASSLGFWFFYANDARYDVELKGGGLPATWTISDILVDGAEVNTGTISVVSFSATPAFDVANASTLFITLTGNVTSSTITNPVDGQIITIFVKQDGVGGRTFVWPTDVVLRSGSYPVASGTNDVSAIELIFDLANAEWQERSRGTDSILTTGSVAFANSSGLLIQDNANFFWNDSTDKLGLGTSSPEQMLHILETGAAGVPGVTGGPILVVQSSGVASATSGVAIISGNIANGILNFGDTDDENVGQILYDHNDDSMQFRANDLTRVSIPSGVDGFTFGAAGDVNIFRDSPNVIKTDDSFIIAGLINTAADDQLLLSNGTIMQNRVLPDCDTAAVDSLQYTPSTNTFSCDTLTVLVVANGGTGQSTATDDSLLVGNGTILELKAVPDCADFDDGLTYDQSTNTFGCNAVSAAYIATCSGTATSSVTILLFPWGQQTTLACTHTGTAFRPALPHSVKLQNLRVVAGTGGVNASSGVVTLYRTGGAQLLTCTLGTSVSCSDTVNSVNVAEGAFISIRVTTQAAETLADLSVTWEAVSQ